MPASPRTQQIRTFAGLRPHGEFLLGTAIGLFAATAFWVPKPAFWHTSPPPAAQAWAGHLASPARRLNDSQPFTSASYTTGFDKAAVAPLSVDREPNRAASDPGACPSDLNCAFRTAQGVPQHATPLPPQQPAAVPPVVSLAAPVPQTNPGPFATLTSRLPAAHLLLKPFAFVADTFTGLIKKL